jgi:hypothetical protein
MAGWRDQKYVPDSDDEEEALSVEDTHEAGQPKEGNSTDDGFLDIDDISPGGKDLETQDILSEIPFGLREHVFARNPQSAAKASLEEQVDGLEGIPEAYRSSQRVPQVIGYEEDSDFDELQLNEGSLLSAQHLRPEAAIRRVLDRSRYLDDEIDELQQDVFEVPSPTLPAAQLATDLLRQVELDTSIRTPPRVESRASTLHSTLSSPLSDLRSTARTKLSPIGPGSKHPWTHESVTTHPSTPALFEHADDNLGYDSSTSTSRPTRTLRKRALIQQHPYAVERERYRQTCKASGVKPIRIDQTQVEEDGMFDLPETNNCQEQESQASSGGTESNIGSSTPRRASSLPTSEPSRPQSQGDEDEDEFPDVSTLLRTAPGAIIQGNKRRKITHTFSKKSKKRGIPELPVIAVVVGSSTHLGPDLSRILGKLQEASTLPSTPTASTPLGHVRPSTKAFRYPPGMSPVQHITPATSSEAKRPRTIEIDEESDPNVAVSQVPSDQSSGSEIPAIESPCESESEHELQHAQRRVRGTLPASWVRLDLNAQSNKGALTKVAQRITLSPMKDPPEKGVARPISSHEYRADCGAPNIPVEIFDDSSSDYDTDTEEIAHNVSWDKPEAIRDRLVSPSLRESVEVMEDNRVDFMLPPRPRLTKIRRTTKDGQSKLAGSGRIVKRKNKHTSLSRKRNGLKDHQSMIFEHILRRPQSQTTALQRRPPKLSILDVTDAAETRVAPSFVRLPARTARAKADKGKHSPSNKFLQLATREETADVQEILKSWKGGTLSYQRNKISTAKPTSSIKTPLAACSGNESRPASIMDEKKDLEGNPLFHHRREDSSLVPKPGRRGRSRISLDQLLGRHFNTTKEQRVPPVKHSKRLHGRMASSLQRLASSRPAMLESNHTPIASTKDSIIDYRQARVKDFVHFSRSSPGPLPVVDNHGGMQDSTKEGPNQPVASKNIRNGKRRPKKVDISCPNFRQDSPPSFDSDEVLTAVEGLVYNCKDSSILQGLGPHGTQYSTVFGITGFLPGVRFHCASFVGSGDFSRSLGLTDTRDLDLPANSTVLELDDTSFEWGSWNDTVSWQLGIAYDRIDRVIRLPDVARSNTASTQCNPTDPRSVIALHRSILDYITKSLVFLDPIDRCAFIQRCLCLMSTLNSDLSHLSFEPACGPSRTSNGLRLHETRIRISMQNLAMVYQVSRLASHSSVHETIKGELAALLGKVARRTLSLSLANGTRDVQRFLRGCVAQFELGEETEGFYEAEAIVVARHILAHGSTPATFWDEVNAILHRPHFDGIANVSGLDHQWQHMMCLLPLLDFDMSGTIPHQNTISDQPLENWSLVRSLVQPVLQAYLKNPRGQGSTFNEYFRTLLTRCFRLVREWKWRKCESIVQAFFDFFATLNLGHLQNEAAHGSPPFLEHLRHELELSIEKEDRSFHIFLKLLGVSLREMRKVCTDKKISGIVWRMMPNHDRHHPKDEAISQKDLDALRNHHDLLCVLYWASPSGFRPRLSVLRNVVHLENSHKEACRISIRAWSNLVNFQISTAEPVRSLEPFAEWCDDILSQVTRQHGLARLEVESQVRAAELSIDHTSAQDVLESTIAQNQRRIEALLSDVLESLRKAIDAVSTAEHAQVLLPKASLAQVFDLFDAKQPRVNRVVVQALDVILVLLKKISCSGNNEDSQGYDWSVFDEELADLAPSKDHRLLPEIIYRSLRRLLSNCFGADVPPEDTLLLKMVNAWTDVAQLYVAEGVKTWNDYIGPYGQDCWDSLSDTEQTRKFTLAFLATLLEKNGSLYQDHRQIILKAWIAGLAERESLLKFQHQLTAAILNVDRDNAILSNPPFWVDLKTERFIVSTTDFRERRLSLISCLLSNMRESLDFNTYHGLPERRSTLKNEYNELIKHLMATMKHNYQELGQGSSIRGMYVDFVQKVVEYLQQHTVDICPIDRFFMDPAAFPLPAKDPSYVVSRLRSYGLRLQDPKTAKQLSGFIQAVSERAVVESQQKYLVEQVFTALSNNVETGDHAKPTLRAFALQAIFPAYIELALRTSYGALLAMPILEATEGVLENITYDINGLNNGCVAAIQTTILVLLGSLKESTQTIVDHPEKLEEPFTLRLLCQFFDVLVAALPTLDYIARLRQDDQMTMRFMAYFQGFAQHLTALLDDDDMSMFLDPDDTLTVPVDKKITATRDFTLTELKNTYQKNWSSHNSRTYFTKGKTPMLVSVSVGSVAEEKARLREHVEEFERVLRCMPWLGGPEERDLPATRLPPEAEHCIF